MSSPVRARHALTLAVLVLLAALDLLAGRDQQAIGLVVIVPLLAATAPGRRATVGCAAPRWTGRSPTWRCTPW